LGAVLSQVRAQLGGAEGVNLPGPKFLLRYTCSHAHCTRPESERTSTKIISQQAYRDGIVLVRCSCDKQHLIADRLGWFGGNTDVEAMLASKGEAVVRTLTDEGLLQL
ncbi:DNL zinc finger-domain-containing protein, partial [Pavlovales sp. CCMP2436]